MSCFVSMRKWPYTFAAKGTFEFLAISGVQEVILFCCSHADQIKLYIAKSRWSTPTLTMHINVIVNNECTLVGDALCDIDARSIIHGDFVLVCGDVVSNLNLARALEEHKGRRNKDRNYIMTMVLKEASPFHRSRERCENGVFVIDSSTGECMAYESLDAESVPSVSLTLHKLLSGTKGEVDICYDLLDCQIDICSVNVLALYTENFDYQDVRRDFLRGVLTLDILGVRVATFLVNNEYATRVRSPHLYDSISRDIIERWVFPVVPDADLLEEDRYAYRRGNFYVGEKLSLSRSATVGKNVVLGSGVTIGENSIVKNSVLGPRCQVGSDVIIENSYIWADCFIENGSKVFSSILADGVRVCNNTIVNTGCLVASNITIGPRKEIPAHTRVAKMGEHSQEVREEELLAAKRVFGDCTDGLLWDGDANEGGLDGEPEDLLVREERRQAFEMGTSFHETRPIYDDASDSEVDQDEENALGLNQDEILVGSDGGGMVYGRNLGKFMDDAYDLMKHAIESDYLVDNAMLEINGLKFSCNANFSECRFVIIKALFDFIDPRSIPKSVDTLLLKWSSLLARFTRGVAEQIDLINAIQSACQSHQGLERSFQNLVPVLYKNDIVEQEAVVEWFQEHEETNSLYIRQIRGFVQWLQQEEDDDDDNDESDSASASDPSIEDE